MAKYTIELRKVCDYYKRKEVEKWFKDYDLKSYLTLEQLKIVDNSPIWDKDKLAKKIVEHYWMREIGFETPALFKHYAKVRMQEIMEEKLPLIYTACIEYDPLINVDFTETFEKEGNTHIQGNSNSSTNSEGSSNSNSSSNSSGISVNSDTPQGQINKQHVLNGNYASNVTANESESNVNDTTTTSQENTANSSNNQSGTEKEKYIRHLHGNQGISATYQAMIKQFRDNIRAIDREIIEELNILFMGIY